MCTHTCVCMYVYVSTRVYTPCSSPTFVLAPPLWPSPSPHSGLSSNIFSSDSRVKSAAQHTPALLCLPSSLQISSVCSYSHVQWLPALPECKLLEGRAVPLLFSVGYSAPYSVLSAQVFINVFKNAFELKIVARGSWFL